jgi:hypothetical protein
MVQRRTETGDSRLKNGPYTSGCSAAALALDQPSGNALQNAVFTLNASIPVASKSFAYSERSKIVYRERVCVPAARNAGELLREDPVRN